MTEFARILELIADVLRRSEIPFVIGGSVASSIRGIYRATNDIHIVAQIAPPKVVELVAALGADWVADAEQIRSAISAAQSFNLIYLPTIYKVDIFPAMDEFAFSQLERATLALVGEHSEYPVATAEDVVLAKLRWYSEGGEVSDSQWAYLVGPRVSALRGYSQRLLPPLGGNPDPLVFQAGSVPAPRPPQPL